MQPEEMVRRRKWWTPRRRGLTLATLIVAAMFLMTYRMVLFEGRSLGAVSSCERTSPCGEIDFDERFRTDPGASIFAQYPWGVFNSRSLRSGNIPHWNPHSAAGTPHLANIQSAPLDPLLVPFHVTGEAWGYDLSMLLASLLGIAATFMFVTRLGFSPLGVLTTTAAYGFSGFTFVFGNNQWSRPYLYLPVLLIGIEMLRNGRGRIGAVVTTVGTAFLMLSGMPEVSAVVLLAAGIYLIAGVQRRADVAQVGAWLGCTAAGLLLALPALLPFFEYLSVAYTNHDSDASPQTAANRFIHFAVPFLNGYPMDSVDGVITRSANNWVGVSAVLLAGAGATGRWKNLSQPHRGCVVGVIVFLGLRYQFGYLDWATQVPPLDQIVLSRFGSPPLVLFIAILAGYTITSLSNNHALRRPALIVAALLIVGLLASGWSALERIERATGSSPRWIVIGAMCALVVLVTLVVASRGTRLRQLALILAAVTCLEVILLTPTKIYPHRDDVNFAESRTTLAGGVIAATDRVFGDQNRLVPSTAIQADVQDIRVVDAIMVDRYRRLVKTFIEPEVERTHFGRAHVTPPFVRDNPIVDLLGVRYHLTQTSLGIRETLRVVFGQRSVDASTRLVSLSRDGVVRQGLALSVDTPITITVPAGVSRLEFEVGLQPGAPKSPEADGFDATVVATSTRGVRTNIGATITLTPGQSQPALFAIDTADVAGATVTLELHGRSNSAGDWPYLSPITEVLSDGYRLLDITESAFIYERPSPLPRAFVVHNVEFVDDAEAAFEAMRSRSEVLADETYAVTDWDPRESAFIELDNPTLKPTTCATRAESTITRYEAERVEIAVSNPCAGYLILSDTYFPGWQATVNGEPVEVAPADGALRAVPVPAGDSVVRFEYHPRAFDVGLVISALTLAAGLLALNWRTLVSLNRRRAKPTKDPDDEVDNSDSVPQ